MNGRLDGFDALPPYSLPHVELAKRGDKQAHSLLTVLLPGQSNRRKSNGRKPSPAIGEYLPDDELAPNLRTRRNRHAR